MTQIFFRINQLSHSLLESNFDISNCIKSFYKNIKLIDINDTKLFVTTPKISQEAQEFENLIKNIGNQNEKVLNNKINKKQISYISCNSININKKNSFQYFNTPNNFIHSNNLINTFKLTEVNQVSRQFSTLSFQFYARRIKKIIAPGSLPRSSNKISTVHTKLNEKFKEEKESDLYSRNFIALKRLHEIRNDFSEEIDYLFSHSSFLKSVVNITDLPQNTASLEINKEYILTQAWQKKQVDALEKLSSQTPLREIAFIGRSNVGKSSIISALLRNPKNMVRISKTPGRTQMLNYFRAGPSLNSLIESTQNLDLLESTNSLFYIVDMPGYGYANAPKHIVEEWNNLVKNYFIARSSNGSPLKMTYLLLDSKVNHIKESDREYIRMFKEHSIPFTILLTKTDKANKDDIAYFTASLLKILIDEMKFTQDSLPIIIPTSSLENKNVDVVRISAYQNCFLNETTPSEYFSAPIPIIHHNISTKAKAIDANKEGKKIIKVLRGERPIGKASFLAKKPYISSPKYIDRVETRPKEDQKTYIRIMRHHNVFKKKNKTLNKHKKYIY